MERLDYRKFGTEGFQLLGQISQLGKKSSLGHVLIELVKLRASQINHCAHCVNMHANALRKEGESEERIQSVVVWEEATCFTAREKAAFAWTESVTLVADTGVPDEVYEEVPRPSGKVIGTKWVMRVKTDASGNLEKYKARVVAKGFRQVRRHPDVIFHNQHLHWRS